MLKKIFVLLVILGLAFGLVLFTLNGYSFEYLWPNSPWLANVAVPLTIAVAIVVHRTVAVAIFVDIVVCCAVIVVVVVVRWSPLLLTPLSIGRQQKKRQKHHHKFFLVTSH